MNEIAAAILFPAVSEAMQNGHDARQLYIDLMKKTLTASVYDESGWESVSASKNPIRNLILAELNKRAISIVKRRPLDSSSRHEGRDWPLFGYTMAGHLRLDNVQSCVDDVLANGIPGDFIETGAWRGGTTIFMRALLKAYGESSRKVWVADSFEGLPKPKNDTDGWDLSDVAYLKVSLEQVKENFRKFDLLDGQVEFLQGWFCDTLPTAKIDQLSILRLDGDLYSSTMDALENLYHKVSPGGYVIVDDYNSWPSCRKAVHDFLAARSLEPEIETIDFTGVYWQV
ncbi:TylF/MycF family methyltransferase [Methylosinus sporium]|nr:TylF/MycF family methyltransferase [Methylosinus sporium]